MENEMLSALMVYSNKIYKILKVNLTEDDYTIIKSDQEEQQLEHQKISDWMTHFARTGQIYEQDMELYKYHTDIEYLRAYFKDYYKKGSEEYWKLRYRRKVGNEYRWVLLEMIPTEEYSDDNQILYFFVQDIDHQIFDPTSNTNALREQYKHAMTQIKIINRMYDLATFFAKYDESGNETVIEFSDQFKELLGFDEEDDFPNEVSSWQSRIHPDDVADVMAKRYASFYDRSNHTKFDVKYRMKMKNGEYRTFHSYGEFQRWTDGLPYYFTGVFVKVKD